MFRPSRRVRSGRERDAVTPRVGSASARPGTDHLDYCDSAVGPGSVASALSGLTAVSGKVPYSLVLRGPSRRLLSTRGGLRFRPHGAPEAILDGG